MVKVKQSLNGEVTGGSGSLLGYSNRAIRHLKSLKPTNPALSSHCNISKQIVVQHANT